MFKTVKPIDDKNLYKLVQPEESMTGLYDPVTPDDYAVMLHCQRNLLKLSNISQFKTKFQSLEKTAESFMLETGSDKTEVFTGYIGTIQDNSPRTTSSVSGIEDFTRVANRLENVHKSASRTPCPACGIAHENATHTIVMQRLASGRYRASVDSEEVLSAHFYHMDCIDWIADQLDSVFDKYGNTILADQLID